MNIRDIVFILPATLAAFMPVGAGPAHASETIVSPAPMEGGASMQLALEAAKAVPLPYPGFKGTSELTGKVKVRFHVGEDGHPEAIQIVQGAHHGELNHQTKESVARAYCAECAGREYTAIFNYQEK